jgi:hypothetical protein
VDHTSIITEPQDPQPHFIPKKTTEKQRERGGISVVGPIDEAKTKVAVQELAERLSGPGVKRGRETAFRCPLHDDRHPSLLVDLEKGVWHCFPCGVGGDVVELARLAWDYPDDGRGAATAAAYLLLEFGHEVPQRPSGWFRKQERQRPVRDAIEQERIEHVRLLVFRLIWVPWLKRLPPWVLEEAEASAWKDSLSIAERLYASRMGSGMEES